MSDKPTTQKPAVEPIDPGTLHPGGGGFKVNKQAAAVSEPVEEPGGFKPAETPVETNE